MPDTELALLEKLHALERSPARITQRALASATGLSLGMTNALVRRFEERGWVRVTRRSTKSVEYAVSPAGLEEISRRAAGYFQQATRSAETYRAKIESFVGNAKDEGATTIVLSGQSDIDYVIESICDRYGIAFVKSADPDRASSLARKPGVVLLYSAQPNSGMGDGGFLLSSVVAGII